MLNLNNVNLKDLKRIGKELKIKGFSTMRRDPMMGAIAEAIEENEEAAATVETMLQQIEAEAPEKTRGSVKPSAGIREVTFNGKTQSIAAWADELGIKRPALYDRINRQGWSIEEALTIPAGGHRKTAKAEVEGQTEIEEPVEE